MVCDFRYHQGRKKQVPLSSATAEGRAFVPWGRQGQAMVYNFGSVVYRDLGLRTLANQFRFAKPMDAPAFFLAD